MTGLLPFFLLFATMFFGLFWGERTRHPLWMAFAIPAALVSGGLLVATLVGSPMRNLGNSLSFLLPFLPSIWIIYGGLSYFVARRNRARDHV